MSEGMDWSIQHKQESAETLEVISEKLKTLFTAQQEIKKQQEELDAKSVVIRSKEKEIMDLLLLAKLDKFIGVGVEAVIVEDPGVTSPQTPEQWAAAKHFMNSRAPGSFEAMATIHAGTFKATIKKEISNAEARKEKLDLSWLPPFTPRQYLKIKERKENKQ